ncbi:hypothetical protein B0J11DRAFT_510567 [Dendryphion nanum]|uniref:C2H2-type domain-containing protein n=1 Tax=Dendryphion nanum TaxID=256645 RepID=A0A9P9DC07_9PLEO|nr:hypothetical protein B0J11DRAFT_510567 [Dendryphion nanum]
MGDNRFALLAPKPKSLPAPTARIVNTGPRQPFESDDENDWEEVKPRGNAHAKKKPVVLAKDRVLCLANNEDVVLSKARTDTLDKPRSSKVQNQNQNKPHTQIEVQNQHKIQLQNKVQTSKTSLSLSLSSPSPSSQPSITSAHTFSPRFPPHWCGICRISFPNKPSLITHIRTTFYPPHTHYCNLCTRIFKDRNGLQNHLSNTADHSIYCNLCLSAFQNIWGLRNHFENNSFVKGHKWNCLVCLLGFAGQKELEFHLKTADKHVSCGTCRVRFQNQKSRDEHWRVTEVHRHCLETGCEFDANGAAPEENAARLEQHLDEGHFRCDECKIILQSSTRLQLHQAVCLGYLLDNADEQGPENAIIPINPAPAPTVTVTATAIAVRKCWFCLYPIPSPVHQIKHLETLKCAAYPSDPSLLIRVLGCWWYSTLYMDIELHAQIRQGRFDVQTLVTWMKEGHVHPFVCRAEGCGKTFAQFRALVHHVSTEECGWNLKILRLDWVEGAIRREMKKGVVVLREAL